MKKLIKTLIIVFASILAFNGILSVGLRIWADNGGGDIANAVRSALGSFNKFDSNKKVREFKETMGGTARGICHPNDDQQCIDNLQEANIEWVRFDIPSYCLWELNEDGTAKKDGSGNIIFYQDRLNSYNSFKNRCMFYQNNGFKVMAITPYIDDMLRCVPCMIGGELSNDCVRVFETRGGAEFSDAFCTMVKEMSAFYAEDLKDYVNCFQISNELTIDKWMGECTTEQIVYYQGELQMKEMYEKCKEEGITIGFNIAGFTLYEYPKMLCDQYGDYFDYIALDLYLGCFEDQFHTTLVYDLLLRNLYYLSGCKPVMINEFGYISGGQPKTDEEKLQFLNDTYGEDFNTEEKIKANIAGYLTKFGEVNGTDSSYLDYAWNQYNQYGADAAIKYVFDDAQVAHMYRALPDGYYLSNYDHTEEGQAAFYKDTIKRLSKLDFVCGYFMYMYDDGDSCYHCGGENCPVETKWGLVDEDGNPKAVFYAIKEVFGEIKEKDSKKYSK